MYIDNRRFEWDSGKARRNALRHGIGFKDAATAFDDPDALLADDPAHSRRERREWLIGLSARGRLLVVVFTMRPGPAIRIISARRASARERERYERNKGIPV